MRIKKLVLQNYRQFKDLEVRFPQSRDNDLHILIGENGTGKTNLLNAINWCLYGDEPHLSRDSQRLPVLNLESIRRTDDGEQRQVIVELYAETTGVSTHLVFRRVASYRVHSGQQPARQNMTFEVQTTDELGNTDILQGEKGESHVNRFVPRKIREFFFFDGERLDEYFSEGHTNIRHAVFKISQLDLLESEIERKLEEVIKDLEKEAGKLNPNIEAIRKELEEEKSNLNEIRRRIREKERQASIAEDKVEDMEEKLSGVPDIEDLESERERLKAEKEKKENLLAQKLRDKHLLLFERGTAVMLHSVIQETLEIIEQKEASGEIPPIVDPSLLRGILEEGVCRICRRDLDEEATGQVKTLLEEIGVSSEVTHRLAQMGPSLRQFVDDVEDLELDSRRITNDIQIYQEDIKRIERRLTAIESEVGGYKEEEVKLWYRQREAYEEEYRQSQRDLGSLQSQEEDAIENVNEAQSQLDSALEKEQKARDIRRRRQFCAKALEVIKKSKQDIMKEVRQQTEAKTQELFFDLTWKRQTFKSVNIGSDYNISLIHSMGYECLGSVSAGERELLALSFTLALHEVSGFDSPILIDTPVARISGKHRENFADVLVKVSNKKQTILLFTPAEYSKEIGQSLDNQASTRYSLEISPDERTSETEVLHG